MNATDSGSNKQLPNFQNGYAQEGHLNLENRLAMILTSDTNIVCCKSPAADGL